MQPSKHRTWAEIDLGAIEHNYRVICAHAKAPVLCVVKADAYGHGAVLVAKRLQAMGAPYFAAATVPEAVELRENGITKPILILGYVDAADMDDIARYHITAPVYDKETAQLLSAAAVRTGETITVHYKLDTGMTRLGFPGWTCAQTVQNILDCAALPGLRSEGIFTHFANADGDERYTMEQFTRFLDTLDLLKNTYGRTFRLRHCAASAAVLNFPCTHLDMVRPGIILYGMEPSDSVQHPLDLRPAMELKTVISQKKAIPAGATVSYGRTFTAEKETIIATVPIGYADGYPRKFSGKAEMLVHGKRAPIVGRVCMDQLMLDVSHIPEAKAGDLVTVVGRDGQEEITFDELAALAGTISYELVCLVGKRVPRVCRRGGKVVQVFDYLDYQESSLE